MTAFEIGDDRTQKHKSCTLGFICRWLLFMFLLVLYFRMLDDMPASRQVFFLCDLWAPCTVLPWQDAVTAQSMTALAT